MAADSSPTLCRVQDDLALMIEGQVSPMILENVPLH